ncbi:hypothetical protein [Kineosporia babensis]|uniref:Uncharacterized protein n=1 Tax=Kineosporia babensis TaxID=499548 RepID=A0A9X1NDR0_9ACTN|nr:hypothetical protein [Kineosporia babensis]MCD5312200.1 hypothetical protein [Kineosporia babensis]
MGGDLAINLAASALFGGLLWLAGMLGRYRRRARTRRFFGLAPGERASVVVGKDTWGRDGSVSRGDVAAMVEVAVVVKSCDAEPDFLMHQDARTGLGEKTEFCVGGPSSNRRSEALLRRFLPGFQEVVRDERSAFRVGAREFEYERGESAVVLVARLYQGVDQLYQGADQLYQGVGRPGKPLFLIVGQTAIANHAGARHLAREGRKLAAKYAPGQQFCVALRLVEPRSYGNNLVEFVGDLSLDAFAARETAD